MKFGAGLFMAALTVVSAGLAAMPGEAQARTFKWITFKPQGAGDAQARSTQWYVDEFKKRMNGKDEIQVFWGGSVAKTEEIPDVLGAGVGDFGDIITPYFPDRFPLNNAVGFFIPQPNSPTEIAHLMEQWHAKYPQFDQELARANLKAVAYRPLEIYGLLCTKPVKSLADFEGLRIRSYGFAYPALIQALGATPVSINTAEGYDALSRNIIDCTPIGPALARGWKYDEVAKYYIEFPFGASFGHLIAMNLDSYNGLDPEARAVVDQLTKDYTAEYTKMLDEDTKRVFEHWKAMGVTMIPFPKDGINKIIEDKRVQAVRQQWIEQAKQLSVPAEKIAAELRF